MYPGIWDSFPSHKAPLAPLIREYLTFLQDLAGATLTNTSSWEVIYSSRIAPSTAFLFHNLPQTRVMGPTAPHTPQASLEEAEEQPNRIFVPCLLQDPEFTFLPRG